MTEWDRREFIKVLTTLPIAIAIGCGPDGEEAAVKSPALDPEESLKKLIRIVGPWSSQEEAQAFATRFVGSEHAVGAYLPGLGGTIQKLAQRFDSESLAVKKLDIKDLPKAEGDLLVNLVKHIYSLTEVRFLINGEPQAGQCQGDNKWHTSAPE